MKIDKPHRILIMAGGTGGHIFPALAIAQQLKKLGNDIAWLGTHQGLEARIIPTTSIPIYYISVSGLRRKGFLSWLLSPFKLFYSLVQSIKVLLQFKPDVVLGMGGYVTGPGGVAAWILRKRFIIHEQNAVLGLTNRLLSYIADKTLTGFPMSHFKGEYVGNPVRDEIIQMASLEERLPRPDKKVHILIFGGSQGSEKLNRMIPEAIMQYPKRSDLSIWHQTGSEIRNNELYTRYKNMGSLRIDAFINNMAEAYQWADIVICRGGASSIAELAAVGVPAIIIPYPQAVDDHQTENARFLVNAGSAYLLPEQQLSIPTLQTVLFGLINSPEQRLKMAKAGRSLRQIHATDKIVEELLK